jgi:hypothetical protein
VLSRLPAAMASCEALRGAFSAIRRVLWRLRGALSMGNVVTFELAWLISPFLMVWVRAGGELALAVSPHFSLHSGYNCCMQKRQVFLQTKTMRSTEKQIKRPPGRPRTGILPPLSTRVAQDVLERVDQWAAANDCTRSAAAAKLIELGLDARPRRPAKRKDVR